MKKVKAGIVLPFGTFCYTTGKLYNLERVEWYGMYDESKMYTSSCHYSRYQEVEHREPIFLLAVLYGCELTFPK